MSGITFLFAATGLIVWVFIGAVVALFIAFGAIPAMFRWMCLVGYRAYGSQAEKDAIAARAKERARIKETLSGLRALGDQS